MSLLEVHANIPYFMIAPIIGMEPIAKYSVSVECPYCNYHSFAIHQDNNNLEEWYYCSRCKANGTIIALAAEKLEMSEIDAIQYLANRFNQNLSPKAVTAYSTASERKHKYIQLWNCAKKQLLKPTEIQVEFLRHLGWQLRTPMSFERFCEGPAELYGVTDQQTAAKYVSRCQVLRKKFPIAVLPFYRTPSVISSLSFISPVTTIHTTNERRTEVETGEPGFAGLQFLEKFNSDVVIATSMLKTMVQLHMHHFSTNMRPLPLVGCRHPTIAQLQKQWSILDNMPIVLWEQEPTATMIHQAMMCDASIAFLGPNFKRKENDGNIVARWQKWVKHDPAIDVWRKIVKTAKPYRQAIINWCRNATPEQKLKLLKDAEQYELNTAKFVRSVLHPKLANSVSRRIRVGTHPERHRSGYTTGFTLIIEKDNKWYDRSGKLRLSGSVRVSHVVVRPSLEQEYIGTVTASNRVIPFRVSKSVASMPWLRNFCMQHGVMLMSDLYQSQIDQHNRFNPFEAAIHFEKPEIVVGLERIGWDGTGFQLNSARLIDGIFHQNPEFTMPEKSPGPKQHYCTMRQEVINSLSKVSTEMEITWAAAIALCAQVTAPAANLPARGVVMWRSRDFFLRSLYYRLELCKGPYRNWVHRWPRRLDMLKKTFQYDTEGFFFTNLQTKVVTDRDIIRIKANEENLQPGRISHSADKIVLHYLRWFSSNVADGNWNTWIRTTRNNMKKVFPLVPSQILDKAVNRISVS